MPESHTLAGSTSRVGSAFFMAQAEYITVTELGQFFDKRQLEQLATDDATTVPTFPSDPDNILDTAIKTGSASVESYALKGGRYSIDTLADLAAADDHTLKSLTAVIAVEWLHKRRSGVIPPAIQDNVTRAYDTLEDLANGKQVFNDGGAIDAGKIRTETLPRTTRNSLNLVSDGPQYPARVHTILP